MALVERRRRIDAGIDLTPLIDVVFQLLIFLMISSQFKKPESQLELPLSKGPATVVTEDPDKVTVGLLSDGRIELNGKPVTRDAFSELVALEVAAGRGERAEIRGDQDARYGLFVELMEELREAGVEKIGIVQQPSDEKEDRDE